MTKKRQKRIVAGIVIMITLLIPVVVLSIPQTYTEVVYHTHQDGFATIVDPEYVEVTVIPLVHIVQNSTISPADKAGVAAYFAVFALAIWLVISGARRKSKEAQQWQR